MSSDLNYVPYFKTSQLLQQQQQSPQTNSNLTTTTASPILPAAAATSVTNVNSNQQPIPNITFSNGISNSIYGISKSLTPLGTSSISNSNQHPLHSTSQPQPSSFGIIANNAQLLYQQQAQQQYQPSSSTMALSQNPNSIPQSQSPSTTKLAQQQSTNPPQLFADSFTGGAGSIATIPPEKSDQQSTTANPFEQIFRQQQNRAIRNSPTKAALIDGVQLVTRSSSSKRASEFTGQVDELALRTIIASPSNPKTLKAASSNHQQQQQPQISTTTTVFTNPKNPSQTLNLQLIGDRFEIHCDGLSHSVTDIALRISKNQITLSSLSSTISQLTDLESKFALLRQALSTHAEGATTELNTNNTQPTSLNRQLFPVSEEIIPQSKPLESAIPISSKQEAPIPSISAATDSNQQPRIIKSPTTIKPFSTTLTRKRTTEELMDRVNNVLLRSDQFLMKHSDKKSKREAPITTTTAATKSETTNSTLAADLTTTTTTNSQIPVPIPPQASAATMLTTLPTNNSSTQISSIESFSNDYGQSDEIKAIMESAKRKREQVAQQEILESNSNNVLPTKNLLQPLSAAATTTTGNPCLPVPLTIIFEASHSDEKVITHLKSSSDSITATPSSSPIPDYLPLSYTDASQSNFEQQPKLASTTIPTNNHLVSPSEQQSHLSEKLSPSPQTSIINAKSQELNKSNDSKTPNQLSSSNNPSNRSSSNNSSSNNFESESNAIDDQKNLLNFARNIGQSVMLSPSQAESPLPASASFSEKAAVGSTAIIPSSQLEAPIVVAEVNDIASRQREEVAVSRIHQSQNMQNEQDMIPLHLKTSRSSKVASSKIEIPLYQEISPFTYSIESFQVGKKLGNGKFADVYAAIDRSNGYRVALKQIKKSTIEEFNLFQDVINEIRIQGSLHHPNIIQLYGFFIDDDSIFLIQELACGRELFAELKSTPYKKFTESQTAFCMRQVIESLLYMHSKGVVHRDIKPENIMIYNGLLKMCDFGYAAPVSKSKMRKTFCGTLDYVSPEMVQGKYYDFSVDIWSVGILTYELLIGYAPFSGRTQEDTFDQIVNGDLRFSGPISFEAGDFITQILQRDPEDRMSLADCMKHPFIHNEYIKRMHSDVGGEIDFCDLVKM